MVWMLLVGKLLSIALDNALSTELLFSCFTNFPYFAPFVVRRTRKKMLPLTPPKRKNCDASAFLFCSPKNQRSWNHLKEKRDEIKLKLVWCGTAHNELSRQKSLWYQKLIFTTPELSREWIYLATCRQRCLLAVSRERCGCLTTRNWIQM